MKPICRAPLSAASMGVSPVLDEAEDIFDDHDGVIDHEADGDGDRHEREIIEAVMQQVHHAKGAGQRERHGDAGDERGPEAAQKEEDHHDDQARC